MWKLICHLCILFLIIHIVRADKNHNYDKFSSLVLSNKSNRLLDKNLNRQEMKTISTMLAAAAVITTIFAFELQPDPWKVPDSYEKMKNPVAPDAASVKAGKELYKAYCRNCHGADGKGTGKRAENLNKPASDFTSAALQQQSDGALLYKIYFGHKDMPGFKKRIPGNQDVIEGTFGKTRSPGDLINYLRTFAKKG
jgi:mono/diheme cytochrome c family protein